MSIMAIRGWAHPEALFRLTPVAKASMSMQSAKSHIKNHSKTVVVLHPQQQIHECFTIYLAIVGKKKCGGVEHAHRKREGRNGCAEGRREGGEGGLKGARTEVALPVY